LADGEGNFAIADLNKNFGDFNELPLAESIVKICIKDPAAV